MTKNTDLLEITQFINASNIKGSGFNADFCIDRLTCVTNDSFLDKRADAIRNELANSEDFNTSISRLASICNEKLQNCKQCPVNKYCNTFIINQQNHVDKTKPTIVDLFCGAGGLSLGFTQEGYRVILANDIEQCCIDTYAHNHPEVNRNQIINGDINTVIDEIKELLTNQDVDVIVGGPPCQGFSMANRQRLIDDPRNYLYKKYVEIVNMARPKFFVMENVRGMLPVAHEVQEDFQRIGYNVNFEVLNAKDFGVPQHRERLIYIGNRVGVNNELIFDDIHRASDKAERFVLKDALFGLRELEASRQKNATAIGDEISGHIIDRNNINETNKYIDLINQGETFQFVCNHKARYNNDRDIEIFGRMTPGDKSDDPKIADIMPYKRRSNIFKDKYFKLEPDKFCKTITAHMKFDCNMYIHPHQARGLTPREAARVQSYPDNYFFKGAYTKTYMQIGNSVPPMLGRVISAAIKKYI